MMNHSIHDLEIPKEKPSLAEIAAMPYPVSELTMRRFYDPLWGKDKGEGDTVKWKVEISYSYVVKERSVVEYEVEACTAEDAKRLAEEMFDNDDNIEGGWDADDFEIDDVDVQEVAQ